MIDNPYFEIFQHFVPDWETPYHARPYRSGEMAVYGYRHDLVSRYSWAVPSPAAIEVVARYSPLVEMGAGAGYWSWLLKQAGADVVAYDRHPPPTDANRWHSVKDGCKHTWTTVWRGGPSMLAHHPDRSLLLCWPPMSNMALQALAAYRGETVVYIGEESYGCCADDAFFDRLDGNWRCVERFDVPQWNGMHDYGSVWKRKEA